MKDLLILILAFSMAVLSYLLVEKNNTSSEEEPKPCQIDYYANSNTPYQIDYFLKNDNIEDSVLFINGGYYDVIDDGLILENPPTGVYELGTIEDFLPRTKIFEIKKEANVKMINFDNTY
ncbi:hypothetical protein WAF17_02380 [Bernardetia sp. ABR2-2B]|uniref:hypothetical protein n=1 Tax=Bernardetia sp. ABR2-2B TaxID=3127472 RepID=UPI0030CFD57F